MTSFNSTSAGHTTPQDDPAGVNVMDVSRGTLDFEAARARRAAGMASAFEHAESDVPGWGAQCFQMLVAYAAEQHHSFTIETFRAWAHARGLPVPAESRAFGPVTQRAIRQGVIVRTGYAPAASSNGSPKPVYSRTVVAA
jgi:hypothetical protein